MMDPAVGALLTAAFALLFASAALHKLQDLRRFAEAFGAYRLLPTALTPLAYLLPFAELAVAGSLSVTRWRTLGVLSGALLLCLYASALALNLARGRRDLSCGCGGPNDRRAIAGWMVLRNLLLAAALAVLLLPGGSRPLAAVDALTIAAGTAVLALLYMSVDALLGRVAARSALLQGSA